MKRVFLIIVALIGVITFSFAQKKEITLEEIWKNYTFYPASVPGFATMPNGDFYTVKTENAIEKFSFKTGEKVGIILQNEELLKASNQTLNLKRIRKYQFDDSETKILFAEKVESIYRRSSKAFYYVYDLNTKELYTISKDKKISYATFSPDGSKVAYVKDYNIFYFDLQTEKEVQITTDGLQNHILNGFADWVYEEELDMSVSFWWSPDGSKISYLRFDESAVKEFSMTMWGELYPEEYRYKYPKAGEDNSVVSVKIFDLKTGKNCDVKVDENPDCYYPRLYWLPNSNDLIVLKLNRLQNELTFYRYNTTTTQMDVVFVDKNEAWLDVTHDYYFLPDNNSMILTSERSGFNHIYKVSFDGQIQQLTQGDYEVKNIASIDLKKGIIYYLSNETSPLNQDIYSIDFKGKKKKMLTDGTGWNSPEFTTNSHYYLNDYSTSNTPNVYAIYDNTGKKLYTLEDNAAFKATIEAFGFVPKEHFTFRTPENIELYGWMIKPANFDANKKYPVLMYVYGGPGSQEVNNSYFRGNDHAWYQMLAQKGYIVVCVDGRGTAGRGDVFKKAIYKQMGKLEAIDQIATANYLKTLPYIDGNRIGIWGWSFGGYLSSLAMFKGEGVFKMAMAVAPVTNWRYYDNIYTERFLQKPQDNPSGYDDNSPCFFAHQLEGNYLLVHGTADDNVHFQNAIDLVTQLNKAEKQYDQFFYPNKNHFIYGGNTRFHLYTKLTNFILENL